jgi:hypothetical protein
MLNFFNRLFERFAAWLFTPKPTQTYTCCSDADEDDKKQEKKQDKKTGGLAY